jgi:MFS family permease
MTSLRPTPDMVALVQSASTLPIMLLALVSGVSADIWDRRMVMLISQLLACAASALLALLAFFGDITPVTLLAFTFLVGCGAALFQPAWQSSILEQLPRSELSAAIALESFSLNLARTAGPAVGGLIVVAFGPPVTFLINSVTYVGLIAALLLWRRPMPARSLPPEGMLAAVGTGLRFALRSSRIRNALVRCAVFGLLGSPIWALLPLVARNVLGGDADTYGTLLGAFGVGAVLGALAGASLRLRWNSEAIVRLCTVGVGFGTVVTAVSSLQVTTMIGLVIAGASWVAAVSTFNVTTQTLSPAWVLGRVVALFHTFIIGGLAIGSFLWGLVATGIGLSTSMLVAGALMMGSALLGLAMPLCRHEGESLEPTRSLPDDYKKQIIEFSGRGRVVVFVTYRVDEKDTEAFLRAMRDLRDLRRRNGAGCHAVMQDAADPRLWVESYRFPSWIEYLRQDQRLSTSDVDAEQRVLAFHSGPDAPEVSRMFQKIA